MEVFIRANVEGEMKNMGPIKWDFIPVLGDEIYFEGGKYIVKKRGYNPAKKKMFLICQLIFSENQLALLKINEETMFDAL